MSGGISRESLYGAAPRGDGSPAIAAAVTDAQLATFRIPRTAPPTAPLRAPFVIFSAYVDNPTGRWWRIAGRWLPPWTIGARLPVDPPADALTVEAVTPAGHRSEAIGDELVIVARSTPTDGFAGIYTAPEAASGYLYASATGAAVPGTAPLFVVIPAPAATERLVLAQLTVSAFPRSADGAGIRGDTRVGVVAMPSGTELFVATISPQLPSLSVTLPTGAVAAGAGESVQATADPEEGAARGAVTVHAVYYRAAVV